MKSTIEFVQKNIAFSLVSVNVILLLLILIINDPFQIFTSTYHNAKPFFKLKKEEISKVTIEKIKSKEKLEIFKDSSPYWKLKNNSSKIYSVDEEKLNKLIQSIMDAKKFTNVSNSNEDFGFGSEDELKLEVWKGNESIGYLTLSSRIRKCAKSMNFSRRTQP